MIERERGPLKALGVPQRRTPAATGAVVAGAFAGGGDRGGGGGGGGGGGDASTTAIVWRFSRIELLRAASFLSSFSISGFLARFSINCEQ